MTSFVRALPLRLCPFAHTRSQMLSAVHLRVALGVAGSQHQSPARKDLTMLLIDCGVIGYRLEPAAGRR